MNRTLVFGGAILVAAALPLALRGAAARPAPQATRAAPASAAVPDDPRLIERGRYLTHDVAMCVQCHTPRDRTGALITEQEFRGAPNPFPAPFPGIPWALRSINIRGLGALPEEAVLRILTTGIGRQGKPPDPPMPRFRMSTEDAQAIVVYLRSLK
jgi:mono/diheme cytochrome c family protein